MSPWKLYGQGLMSSQRISENKDNYELLPSWVSDEKLENSDDKPLSDPDRITKQQRHYQKLSLVAWVVISTLIGFAAGVFTTVGARGIRKIAARGKLGEHDAYLSQSLNGLSRILHLFLKSHLWGGIQGQNQSQSGTPWCQTGLGTLETQTWHRISRFLLLYTSFIACTSYGALTTHGLRNFKSSTLAKIDASTSRIALITFSSESPAQQTPQ
ncbi:hypothetical protein F4782DRAFT_534599 [Xylaria castorea]|nr:hypothetical protein F4782DRAFT_534599 [Xylaria castorea]